MLKHLFKMIWNKKKENFLLISEILISFMVMFAVFTLIIHFYNNYQKPMGFEYKDVWSVEFQSSPSSQNKDSISIAHELLKNALMSQPKVKSVSYVSFNTPFIHSTSSTNISYKHLSIHCNTYNAEKEYLDVLKLPVIKGRWFNAEDKTARIRPIVINRSTAIEMGVENPVGIVLGNKNENQNRIIGVVEDFKDMGSYTETQPGMYTLIDTSNVNYMRKMLIRVSPDADAAFESTLYKLIANTEHSSSLEIQHLPELLVTKNKDVIIPMIILLVVSGFLIFNVALGLFGVLWYNISKRRGEIGLRRAIGASASGVSYQLVGEALVLATFSLIIGSFFAIQFPLLNVFDLKSSEYVVSILLSIGFIYLLVIVCALYPGKQAGAIQPAVALHED